MSLYDKNHREAWDGGNIPQHNNGYMKHTDSQHHAQRKPSKFSCGAQEHGKSVH